MEDSERRKVAELLKEMRKEGDKSTEEKSSLGWMYKGSSDLIDREEYLLGKSIDKSFEVSNNAGSSNEYLGRTSELSNVPKKLLERNDCTDQIDLTNKKMDDPLYAIKEKEMEARRKLLSNPVKLKEIKQMLLEKHKNNTSHIRIKGEEKRKKKKKKKLSSEELNKIVINKLKKFNDKEKRKALKKIMKSDSDSDSDSSSSENSSNEDDVKKNCHVKRKRKRERSSTSDSESSKSSDKSRKIKKSKKKRQKSHHGSKKRKKKQHVEDSSSSDSDSSDHEKKKKHRSKRLLKSLKTSRHKRAKKSSSSSSNSSSSSSSDSSSSSSSSDEESSDDSEEVKKSNRRNEKRLKTSTDTKSKHHDKDVDDIKKSDKTSSKRRRDDKHDTNKRLEKDSRRCHSSDDDSVKVKKSYGLMVPEGSNPISHNRSLSAKKYEKPVEPKTKYVPPSKPKHLSEKEKAEKIKEMMEEAKRRKKDRERNLANHKKAVSQEESIKTYDDDFMRRQMSKMGGTMADRIKSNINNIQRSKSSMDDSFVRK